MKTALATFFFLFLSNCTFAQAPATNWVFTINGTGPDAVIAVATDGSGNIYSTGYFSGTIDFDPGPGITNLTSRGSNDLYLAKHDSAGRLIWAKSFGGKAFDYITSLKRDETGNLLITGSISDSADLDPGAGSTLIRTSNPAGYDAFLLKTDSSGNLIFAMHNELITYLETKSDAAKNIYTFGYFFGTCDFDPGVDSFKMTSAGARDMFISKFNAAGSFIWARRIGGTSLDQVNSLAIVDDKLYAAGVFQGAVDFDPGPGVHTLSGLASKDNGFLMKLDTTGNFIWAKNFSGTDHQAIYRIIASGGYLYTASYFVGSVDLDPGPDSLKVAAQGSFDMAVGKYDTSGRLVWAKAFGGKGSDQIIDLTQDSLQTLMVAGYFDSTVDFDPGPGTFNVTVPVRQDAFLLKMDTAGTFKWVDVLSSNKSDDIRTMAFDPWGNIFICGEYGDTLDFDNGPAVHKVPCTGPFDGFLVKLGNNTPPSGVGVHASTMDKGPLLSPNPATNTLIIEGVEEICTVRICDMSGRTILSYNSSPFHKMIIDVASLADGLYFAETTGKNGAIFKTKFVKI